MKKLKAADKVWPLTGLPAIVDRRDRKLVLAHGCFDPLHAGHVRHLEEAAALGDVLVVTVTADRWIDKPGHPAFPEAERALVVAALECVDFVAVNRSGDATEAIRLLRPDVFVKGGEYRGRETPALLREKQLTNMTGGALIFTSDAIQLSSTEMLRRLTECV